ncbi:MAG: hypothetical protein KDC85_08175 [Saprospiraceae bacterium]|nr:hypothetical protein [Saprospiraceae bacterium]MCB9324517.1 hypothetical protein [Lewinellaceae bacterium]
MKPPSSFLFDLIKSLTKSEKRYLKLGLSGTQAEHVKLFDAIVRQEHYDEEILKAEYGGNAFVQNLPVYKNYLYRFILNRLSQYHQKSESAEIFEKVRFAEILTEKKLTHQAKRQLAAAEKLAEKYQLPGMLLLVSNAQQLLLTQSSQSVFKEVQPLYRIQKEALKALEASNEYNRLFSEISDLQIRMQKAGKPEEFNTLEAWRNHPLLKEPPQNLPVQNKILYFKSIAIYHFTRDEPLEASRYNKRILDLLEQEVEFNKRHPEQYLSTLNNFIIDQLTLKNIPAFEEGLRRLEQLPDNPAFVKVKNIKARIFHQRYLLFFNYCYSDRAYSKAMEVMADFQKELRQFEGQLKLHQRFTLDYLAAVLCFGARRFREAQEWLLPILQESREEVVLEIFRYARILNLLIHFELEHYEFIHSLLPATSRAIAKKGAIVRSESMLLRFLRRSLSVPGRKEKEQLVIELSKELSDLQTQPGEQRLFNYIPVLEWLEGHSKTGFHH